MYIDQGKDGETTHEDRNELGVACSLLPLLLLILTINPNFRLSSQVSYIVVIVVYLVGVRYVCVIDMKARRMMKYRFVLPCGLFVYHDVRKCLLHCIFIIRPTLATVTSFVSSKLNVIAQ
jgi:hypothetical protein